MQSHSRVFTAAALATAVVLGALPGPVAAAHQANCTTSVPFNRFSGHEIAGNKQGVRAVLEGQSLDLCLNPDDDAANVALINIEGAFTNGNNIVQIGVGRCNGSANCPGTMSYYWAWGRDNAATGCGAKTDVSPSPQRLGTWEGVSRTYIVTHTGSFWKGYINGVERASVADSEICWVPVEASWWGESLDTGDPIGGPAGNKYAITGMRMQNVKAGSWVSPSLNAANACNITEGAPYFCDVVTSDSLSIWTNR